MSRCLGLLAVVLCTGCAATAGRVSASGTHAATDQLLEDIEAVPPEQHGVLAERISAGAVRGLLDELSTPERQEQLSLLLDAALLRTLHSLNTGSALPSGGGVGGSGMEWSADGPLGDLGAQLADGFATAMMQRLEQQLGSDGEGPLGLALAGSTRRLASSAVSGAKDELGGTGAGCPEGDPFVCAQKRVHALASAATSGAISGIKWWLVLGVFFLGFMFSAALREMGRAAGAATRWWRQRS